MYFMPISLQNLGKKPATYLVIIDDQNARLQDVHPFDSERPVAGIGWKKNSYRCALFELDC